MKLPPLISLLISCTSNLLLVFWFALALLNPTEHAYFIFNTGLILFSIEFLSIHSGGMLAGTPKEHSLKKSWFHIPIKLFLVSLYSIFVLAFAFAFKNYWVPLFFIFSLVGKVFGNKAKESPTNVALSIVLFIGSVFLIVMTASLWESLFPFPAEVFAFKPENTTGMFVEQPQTLLVWGVLYYILTAITEIALFVRRPFAPS